MKKTEKTPTNAAELRHRAEERLKEAKRDPVAKGAALLSTEDAQRLIHELQVHQIELEMQNEELQRSRSEVEAGLAIYSDLYDFSPVGYFTLDREGTIRQANLTGARLLGMERRRLEGCRLGHFVSEADRSAFTDFLQKVFANLKKEPCEVSLRKGTESPTSSREPDNRRSGGTDPLVVSIEAIASEDGQDCRVVMTDVTERRRAEEGLRRSHDQLRALAIRLQEVREETRTAISHDLHDDVGANLAGLKMHLMKLDGLISKVGDVEQRAALIAVSDEAKELINTTIRSARRLMMEMRPSVLDDFGLVAALEWQLEEFRTHTSIPCQFAAKQQKVDLEKHAATAVFRIFQEVLSNIARHARATEIFVRLSGDQNMIILEVIDKGRGITEEQLAGEKSLGLMGMKEQALALGGSIQVRGALGEGTTVTLRVPMGPTSSELSGRQDEKRLET